MEKNKTNKNREERGGGGQMEEGNKIIKEGGKEEKTKLALPIKLNKGIKLIPNHKELEYLKKHKKNYKETSYTITGLYSIVRIKAMIKSKVKFNEEVDNLKQILIDYGENAIFTPVISKKAINHETNEILIKLQKEAGLKRITIIEKNINETTEEMESYFKEYINKEGKENIFPLLDIGMFGVFLLSNKLKKLKEMEIGEVGLHFAGYWKYRNNLLLLLETEISERPKVLFCGLWEKLGKTPLPTLISLFNTEKISVGFKWGGKPRKDKPLERLNEVAIEYYTLSRVETNTLKKSVKVASNDELYSYLRAETYEKNKRIIERLSKLGENRLKEYIKKKKALAFFFS